MKIEHKVIVISTIVGLFAVGTDVVVDSLIFREGSLLDQLTFNIPMHEMYMRSVILLSIVMFGIFVSRYFARVKRSEETLQKSKNRFDEVAKSAQEWIWEVDASGLYTYASPMVDKDAWL